LPTEKIGVAILTNGSGYGTGQLGMYGLALLLGKNPESLPFVRRQRMTAELEGVYETYKGTMKRLVKHAGDFIMLIDQDRHNTNTTPLIPEKLTAKTRRFYTLDSGNKIEAEFRLKRDRIELIIERYMLRRTGKLS
jgi:hypothetical protein